MSFAIQSSSKKGKKQNIWTISILRQVYLDNAKRSGAGSHMLKIAIAENVLPLKDVEPGPEFAHLIKTIFIGKCSGLKWNQFLCGKMAHCKWKGPYLAFQSTLSAKKHFIFGCWCWFWPLGSGLELLPHHDLLSSWSRHVRSEKQVLSFQAVFTDVINIFTFLLRVWCLCISYFKISSLTSARVFCYVFLIGQKQPSREVWGSGMEVNSQANNQIIIKITLKL